MSTASTPQFYILEGVRRAVAAREEGWIDVPALVVEPGKADVLTRLKVDQLHSPKPIILRDYRYIRHTEYPTRVLKTQPPAIDYCRAAWPAGAAPHRTGKPGQAPVRTL
jgi:hypothetical protein